MPGELLALNMFNIVSNTSFVLNGALATLVWKSIDKFFEQHFFVLFYLVQIQKEMDKLLNGGYVFGCSCKPVSCCSHPEASHYVLFIGSCLNEGRSWSSINRDVAGLN